ncbi:MAG: hypothetical protein ACHBN1_07210 [Heteroscytonema crispum UTEX LB 1556]
MKQPNFLELTKQKIENFPWVTWFPYPISWLRTFILIPFIAITLATSFRFTGFWGVVLSAITNHRKILILAVVLGLLIPMLLLAYIHHFFTSFLKKRSVSTRYPRWLSSPNSLWEGFYAKLVTFLSLLVSVLILIPFLPFVSCKYDGILLCYCHYLGESYLTRYWENNYLDEINAGILIITAAYLDQAEYIIRQRLIPKLKVVFQKSKSKSKTYKIDKKDVDLDRLRGDLGLTQMKKGNKNVSPIKLLSRNQHQKSQKLGKKLLIILLIPLVAVRVYLF